MKRRRLPWGVGLGFIAIALGLFGFATFLVVQVVPETRIGRGLIFEGEPTSALVVTAERLARSRCSSSQRFECWSADIYVATVVYEVDGLRSGTELRLTSDEYAAYVGGAEVFIDLIYLPSAPAEAERRRGTRLNAAERDTTFIYILAAFGVVFGVIGGIALHLARKQTARPSTGPDA